MWTLNGALARWQAGGLAATLDVRRPAQGLTEVSWGNEPLGQWLGVLAPALAADCEPADCYVRGCDLIVTYAAVPDWPVRLEMYWRGAIQGHRFDLQISVQTHLLDSAPDLTTTTQAPARALYLLRDSQVAETREADLQVHEKPGVIVCRGTHRSYVEMVHPSDYCGTRVRRSTDDAACVRIVQQLFHERLEKGVIRRARVRSLLVAATDDTEQARREYEAFAAEEADLST